MQLTVLDLGQVQEAILEFLTVKKVLRTQAVAVAVLVQEMDKAHKQVLLAVQELL